MGVCHSESTAENKETESESSSELALSEIEFFTLSYKDSDKLKTLCLVNNDILIRTIYNDEINKQKFITSSNIKQRNKQAKQ